MIEVMEWLAIGSGVLIGWLVASRYIDFFLIIFYCALFNSRYTFDAMYSAADDEVTYEYLKQDIKEFKSYADYLRIHKLAQLSSYKLFRQYYDALVGMLLIRVAPITLLPAVIFWSNWYLYLVGVVIIFAILFSYGRLVKHVRAGKYQRLMILAVLRNYLRDLS